MPVKYVPFISEPAEGQAVLQDFSRILKYKGSDGVSGVLKRGMPLYEVEKRESVGENAGGNMVLRGECVSACAYLKEKGVKVDLVYIDPPFSSGADYSKKVYIRRNPKAAEVNAKAGKNSDIGELKAFEEKMYGDVWEKDKYLSWMWENLMAIRSVMSETASIYVHLDFKLSHYVKILMDEIFGEENFRNEIIWYYENKPQFGFMRHLPHDHDSILLYTKTDDYIINHQLVPVKAVQKQAVVSWDPVLKKRIAKRDENGRIIYEERSEKYMGSVWTLPLIHPSAKERIGYPTQKPESLLERIINISTDKGMTAADFFGGSGVTAAVAARLGRRFIHCDIGINSIQTTRDRLISNGVQFDVFEIRDGVRLYRNPVQTMDKIRSLIPGFKKENSLDPFWEGAAADSRLGTVPVYIPNLMDSSAKLLDKALMERIINQAIPELDGNIKKVIVYYIDIADRDEIQRSIDKAGSAGIEIGLRDLKTILDNAAEDDHAEFRLNEANEESFTGYEVIMDKFVSDRVQGKIREFNNKNISNSRKGFKPVEISEDGLELIELLSVDCTDTEGEWHSDSEVKIDKYGYVSINGKKTENLWDGTLCCDRRPLRLKIRNICGDETVWRL